MTVSKSDSKDPVSPGEIFSYDITVRNVGDARAENVLVEDTLPGGVTRLGVTGNNSCAPTASGARCLFDTFPPGNVESVTISVQVNSGASGSLTNRVDVFSSNAPTVSDTETTTVSSSLQTRDAGAGRLNLRSFLDVAPYDGSLSGRIVANGTNHHQVTNTGFVEHLIEVEPGLNRIEAIVQDVGSRTDGYWRFDLETSPRFVEGSLRVESGQVVQVGSSSIVFAVRRGAPSIRFTLEVD